MSDSVLIVGLVLACSIAFAGACIGLGLAQIDVDVIVKGAEVINNE